MEMWIVGTKKNGDQMWVPTSNIAHLTWHTKGSKPKNIPGRKQKDDPVAITGEKEPNADYTVCALRWGTAGSNYNSAVFFAEHPVELFAKAVYTGPSPQESSNEG